MTKKDYELLAEIINARKSCFKYDHRHHLVADLARRLQRDNPNFDAAKFYAACGEEF